MNHTPSGRRKKKIVRRRKKTQTFVPLQSAPTYRRETPYYPSADGRYDCTVKTPEYKKQVSTNYTVAIAFNKGAYQVIGKDNVKDIGK